MITTVAIYEIDQHQKMQKNAKKFCSFIFLLYLCNKKRKQQ